MAHAERAPETRAVEPAPSSAASPSGPRLAIPDGLLGQPTLNRPVAVALLVATVAAPYLKGLVAGLALAGAAGAVSEVLAAGRL